MKNTTKDRSPEGREKKINKRHYMTDLLKGEKQI
jgi:hypothetical protein